MSEKTLRDLSDEEFCYLTTVGRVSGRPHEIEIWFAVSATGESLYMLSGGRDRSDWVKNLIKTPKVRVRVSGETFEGLACAIEGEEEDELARSLLVEKYEKRPGSLSSWRERSLPVRVDVSA